MRQPFYIVIIGILILIAGQVFAAAAGAAAAAGVIEPLDINKTADLRFGRVFYSAAAHTITVAPDGTRIASDNAILGDGDPVSAAAFLLHGQPGDTFHIFPPPKTITLTNGAQSLLITDFTCSIKTSNNGVLGSDGMFLFTYGATAYIDAGQAPGLYTGTFTIAVNYQ